VPAAKYLLLIMRPQAGCDRLVTWRPELFIVAPPLDLAHEVGNGRPHSREIEFADRDLDDSLDLRREETGVRDSPSKRQPVTALS
jgi:hypothetical protein